MNPNGDKINNSINNNKDNNKINIIDEKKENNIIMLN